MEHEMSLETAMNNLKLYNRLYCEHEKTIEMLEDSLSKCTSNNDKRYRIIVDELMETTKSARGIKNYIEFYENFIKEHSHERNFNEVDKAGSISETSD